MVRDDDFDPLAPPLSARDREAQDYIASTAPHSGLQLSDVLDPKALEIILKLQRALLEEINNKDNAFLPGYLTDVSAANVLALVEGKDRHELPLPGCLAWYCIKEELRERPETMVKAFISWVKTTI